MVGENTNQTKAKREKRDELISLVGTGDTLCRRGGERKRKMF
jgi:hypothetical protein